MSKTDNRLWNPDIAPVDPKVKNWGYLPLLGVWASIAAPNSALVGSVGILFGFNWLQVVLISLLGDLITLIPLIIQSHGAVNYGLAEPQLDRTRFGIWGTYIPSWIRFFVAIGFFGVQTFLINEAIVSLFLEIEGKSIILNSYTALTPYILVSKFPILFWTSFIIVIIFQILILIFAKPILGSPSLKILGYVMPFISLIALTIAFIYFVSLYPSAFYKVISSPPATINVSEFLLLLLFLNSNIHATQVISWPNLMRFGKSFRHMVVGQIGLPLFYTTVVAYGAIMAGISKEITGSVTYDPTLLIVKFANDIIGIPLLIAYAFTMLNTNIFSNVVPPVYDLINTFPSKLSWIRGVIIVSILGIVIGAWSLYLKGAYTYFDTWIAFISGLLGPIAGIIVADYAILRKFKINLHDVFVRKGEYTFYKGFNLSAILTLIIIFPIIFSSQLHIPIPYSIYIYKMSWISGFLISIPLYLLLTKLLTKINSFL
jgi:NCS1 family nucleobase:cation symporter-1